MTLTKSQRQRKAGLLSSDNTHAYNLLKMCTTKLQNAENLTQVEQSHRQFTKAINRLTGAHNNRMNRVRRKWNDSYYKRRAYFKKSLRGQLVLFAPEEF